MEVKKKRAVSKDIDKYPRGQENPDGVMTAQQTEFVRQFVHFKLNQTAAARAAGYPAPNTTANWLMWNPKIIKAIARERAEYAVSSGMTQKKVIDGFIEAIDMARIKADPLTMIAGWREVGKMCGLYEATKSKLEISVGGQVTLQKMQGMSDAELLALAYQDPKVLEGEFSVVGTSESETEEPDGE